MNMQRSFALHDLTFVLAVSVDDHETISRGAAGTHVGDELSVR